MDFASDVEAPLSCSSMLWPGPRWPQSPSWPEAEVRASTVAASSGLAAALRQMPLLLEWVMSFQLREEWELDQTLAIGCSAPVAACLTCPGFALAVAREPMQAEYREISQSPGRCLLGSARRLERPGVQGSTHSRAHARASR